MEIRRLSYFIRIAEEGSLTRAAGVLRVAQSALSRQMRLLEEEVGVALFERGPRGMRLTERGILLRDTVAEPLRTIEAGLQVLRAAPPARTVTIGLAPNLGEVLGEPLARHFRAAFPAMRLKLVEALSGSLAEWLARGIVDVALIEETARNEALIEQRLARWPLVLAGEADPRLPVPGTPVALATALALPLVLPSHHLGVRGAIGDAARASGLRVAARFEADSARLIRRLLPGSGDFTLLPEPYCRAQPGEAPLAIWPLAEPTPAMPPPAIELLLATRGSGPLSAGSAETIAAAIGAVVNQSVST
jgi:DNA-binding transcriptional LysR family regulator